MDEMNFIQNLNTMRLLQIGILSFCAAWMVSCSDEHVPEPTLTSTPSLVVSVADADSKALITGFTSGDQLGFCLTQSGSTAPYEGEADCFNAPFTYLSSGDWRAERTINLVQTEGKAYAYFPYVSDLTDGTAVPLTNGVDRLFTRTPQRMSATNSTAVVQLGHAMALIKLTLASQLGTVSRVRLRKVPMSGTLNLYTGVVTPSSETTVYDMEAAGSEWTTGIPVVPGTDVEVMVYTNQGCYVSKPGVVTSAGKVYNLTIRAN